MMELYENTCSECSRLITQRYSTSFSMGIRAFSKEFRAPIYAIYGFVRFADEIVDTFHQYDKKTLLQRFKADTYTAIEEGISLNPVLHSFQQTVRQYHIDYELIDAFLHSMEMDLTENKYADDRYQEYIYGSAEVVGLMCLRVFCYGDTTYYEKLKPSAKKLGAAFQKINFLRDMQSDFDDRGRVYFPGVDFQRFDDTTKAEIERDIAEDFRAAYEGIIQLPAGARFGVYLAYKYYIKLLDKIRRTPAATITQKRIRVKNRRKVLLLFTSAARMQAFRLGYNLL